MKIGFYQDGGQCGAKFEQILQIKQFSLKLELEKGVCMRPDPTEYLAQVLEVLETEVVVRIDLGLRGFISLPRELCPETCVPGGSFYLLTQGVDPEEEQKTLDNLLGTSADS